MQLDPEFCLGKDRKECLSPTAECLQTLQLARFTEARHWGGAWAYWAVRQVAARMAMTDAWALQHFPPALQTSETKGSEFPGPESQQLRRCWICPASLVGEQGRWRKVAVVPVVPLWPRSWIVWLKETYFMEKIIQYLHHRRRGSWSPLLWFPWSRTVSVLTSVSGRSSLSFQSSHEARWLKPQPACVVPGSITY